MHKSPKVSIIIPTFNRSELLIQTLLSVKNQTLKNWECIIIDDGSTDNTEDAISNFISDDIRFKYSKRPESYVKGAASCRNYGFELSKGNFIQWLDDDDLLSFNKLELQVLKLETLKNSKIFTTCDWDFYWPNKKFKVNNLFYANSIINAYNFFYELRSQQTFIPYHCYLVPRDLVSDAGPWNASLSLNDDAEYFTRIFVNSEKLINTKDCFVLYRDHDNLRLSRKIDAKGVESFILSLKLMHANLKKHEITCVPYFKWKLLEILYHQWNLRREVLQENKLFFRENDININYANYYILKHSIYKLIYPIYKKIKSK